MNKIHLVIPATPSHRITMVILGVYCAGTRHDYEMATSTKDGGGEEEDERGGEF